MSMSALPDNPYLVAFVSFASHSHTGPKNEQSRYRGKHLGLGDSVSSPCLRVGIASPSAYGASQVAGLRNSPQIPGTTDKCSELCCETVASSDKFDTILIL